MENARLIAEINQSMINLFGKKLKRVILYGSYARNTQTPESDIDFLVLVDDSEDHLQKQRYKIAEIMTEVSLDHDILVSITEVTYQNYLKYGEILPFYKQIQHEGINVYG